MRAGKATSQGFISILAPVKWSTSKIRSGCCRRASTNQETFQMCSPRRLRFPFRPTVSTWWSISRDLWTLKTMFKDISLSTEFWRRDAWITRS